MRLLPVFVAGLLTTALMMLAMIFLRGSLNIMGFYLWYIVPAGAICIGLLASSGYWLAIKFTRVQVKDSLIFCVLLLQLLAYFGSCWLNYRLLSPFLRQYVGFWEYFDAVTRSFTFGGHDDRGTLLGAWGYGIRVLEALGFAGGALSLSAFQLLPICEHCKRQQSGKSVCFLPAESDTEIAQTQQRLNQFQAALDNSNAQAVTEIIDAVRQGTTTASTVKLALTWCPSCKYGHFRAQSITSGEEPLIEETLLPDLVSQLPLKRWSR